MESVRSVELGSSTGSNSPANGCSTVLSRKLAAAFLFAFASFAVQAAGLIGSQGISPVGEYLQSLREYYGSIYWQVPTVFWLNAGDRMIKAVGIFGIFLSVLLVLGLRWRIVRVL